MSIFAQSMSHVSKVNDLVADRVQDAVSTADAMREKTESVLNALASFSVRDGNFDIPGAPEALLNFAPDFDIGVPRGTSFGTITANIPPAPGLEAIPGMPTVHIPDFLSAVPAINLPDAPPALVPGDVPARPTIDDTVVLPSKPTVTLPDLPVLDTLTIPAFSFPVLPTFDVDAPEFDGATAVPTVLQWAEPEYRTVILDEVVARLRQMWAGGSGLPPAVEQAMWERAASREDLTLQRAVREVVVDFSSRGFTMPTGMQAARVDALMEEGLIRKQGLQRELTIQVAQWQIENLRFACERAVAAENVFVSLFENGANRMFEAAKLHVQLQLDVMNAQIALFNARQSAYQVRAQVYKAQLDAALASVELYKAQLQGEIAKGQINEQRVKTFAAVVDSLRLHVEMYKAEMEGAKTKSDVVRNQIDAYKADVSAYAERLSADKARYEVFESQVRGEMAKANLVDAEARAFAAIVQGKAAQIDAGAKQVDAAVNMQRAQLEAFKAQVEGERARIVAQEATITAAARAFEADTQRMVAEANSQGEVARVEIAAQETVLRTNVAMYEAATRSIIAQIETMINKARVQLEALAQAGDIGATLAAGAMAGVSTSVSLGGDGRIAATGGYNESLNLNEFFGG